MTQHIYTGGIMRIEICNADGTKRANGAYSSDIRTYDIATTRGRNALLRAISWAVAENLTVFAANQILFDSLLSTEVNSVWEQVE